MQHAAGGEDADRRTRGLSLPCRAAYTQPERPKGMRERSAISVMLSVLRTGRSLTQWSALLIECYPTGRKWPKSCKCVPCGTVTVTRRAHVAARERAGETKRPGPRWTGRVKFTRPCVIENPPRGALMTLSSQDLRKSRSSPPACPPTCRRVRVNPSRPPAQHQPT
jgi:hypothetical protein